MKTKTTESHDGFHIVTDFSDGASVSTVLPYYPTHRPSPYETCVFHPNGDNEVVEHYESEAEARAGHAKWVDNVINQPEEPKAQSIEDKTITLLRAASRLIRYCNANYIAIRMGNYDYLTTLNAAVEDLEFDLNPWIAEQDME